MLLERPLVVEGRAISVLRSSTRGRHVALIAAVLTFALHAAGNPHYGFFRDELYFIVCGRHPALGYADQPSLVPLMAALSQVFGLSLFALRAIPAIFAALATYVACIFADELGGGAFAVALAAVLTIVSPVLMAFGARLSPDTVEMVVWPLIALLVWRITKGADERWWLGVGALLALAAWSKYSIAFFAVAMLGGLLLTPERRVLRSRWFYAGALLCAVLAAPNVWWQWRHAWPMLQLLHNDYGRFLLKWPIFPLQQIMIMSPLLSVAWLVGLWWTLTRPSLRFLGYTYLVLIAIMWALQAKNYYPAPVYPYLIAVGAVRIDSWIALRRRWRVAIIALVAALAIPSTPFVLPVLPMHQYLIYQTAMGKLFGIDFHVEKSATNAMPIQYYADMTGWPQLAARVGGVYASLPAGERARTAIYAHNFGEASAIDIYGKPYGLPPALSGNNNYWIWGTRGERGTVAIDVNGRELLANYKSAKFVGIYYNPLGMPYENNLPIWVLRGPRESLAAYWPRLKNYSYAFGGL